MLPFPTNYYRFVLQFALQFPNLQNLTIEDLQAGTLVLPGLPIPAIVCQSPPLRGHLRCAGITSNNPRWPRELAFDLPNGINFRSVEFETVHWEQGLQILDGCANSLEEFTVRIKFGSGEESLPCFFCTTETGNFI